jgi:ribose transport system substrate-binding protein
MVSTRLNARLTSAAAVVASTLLITAACGNSADSGSGGNGGSEGSGGSGSSGGSAGVSADADYENFDSALKEMGDETVDTSKFKKDGPVTIVSSWHGDGNGWGQTYSVSLAAAAEEYGDRITLKPVSFDFDPNKQVAQLQNAVNTQPDAIIVEAGDVGALVAPVAAAEAAGIPVVMCIDGVLGNQFTSWVGQDFYSIAFNAATGMADEIGGEGEVAILSGIAGNIATVIWEKAAKEAFAEFPDIEVVETYNMDWDVAKAREQTTNLIAAHPEIKGIFAGGSEGAVGAIEAYAAAGKEMPAFGVVNVLNGFLRLAKEHDVKFSGYPLAPSMSSVCLKQAMDILDGKPVNKYHDASVDLPGGGEGYTQDAIDDYFVPELNDSFVPPATASIDVYAAAGMAR